MIAFRVAAATRADRAVAEQLGASRSAVARAFAAGAVRVNGRRARKGDALAAGDLVEVAGLDDPAPVPQPELPLDVLHEDEALLALAKPGAMPSCPLEPRERGTLANALVARYPECVAAGGDPREAGLAQRLDAGTTGVLLAARARPVWEALRRAFREGRVRKEYLALVQGPAAAATIDEPIAHDRAAGGVRVGARAGALAARTVVEPLAARGGMTLVRCVTVTGRMHQVRAHLAARGWPVVGDGRYGGGEASLAGHFLHAASVALLHPIGGRRLVVRAPLPADRAALLRSLGLAELAGDD